MGYFKKQAATFRRYGCYLPEFDGIKAYLKLQTDPQPAVEVR
jgi:hypothetical protein